MNDGKVAADFYRKKMELYQDAEIAASAARRFIEQIKTLEKSAPGADQDEINELRCMSQQLNIVHVNCLSMADALHPLVDWGDAYNSEVPAPPRKQLSMEED